MAILAPQGPFRAFDQNVDPLSGGKLYTYEAGTSTPKVTYSTEDESSANANPVILDDDGYANVWLESGSYKFVLDSSADVNQWTLDNVAGSSTGIFGASVSFEASNFNLTSAYENNLIVATASITISLLAASIAEQGFIFSVQNASSGNLTIDPDGSQTINGALTLVIPAGGGATIVCDGTNWQVISLVNVTIDGDNVFTGDNEISGSLEVSGSFTVEDVSYANAIVPYGSIMAFPTELSVPAHYLVADGSTFDELVYPNLYTALGDSNTLPDLRGEFIRGADLGRGVDSGRVVGSTQSDELKAHTHTYSISSGNQAGSSGGTGMTSNTGTSTGSTGGTETRPRNVAFVYALRAL